MFLIDKFIKRQSCDGSALMAFYYNRCFEFEQSLNVLCNNVNSKLYLYDFGMKLPDDFGKIVNTKTSNSLLRLKMETLFRFLTSKYLGTITNS